MKWLTWIDKSAGTIGLIVGVLLAASMALKVFQDEVKKLLPSEPEKNVNDDTGSNDSN